MESADLNNSELRYQWHCLNYVIGYANVYRIYLRLKYFRLEFKP